MNGSAEERKDGSAEAREFVHALWIECIRLREYASGCYETGRRLDAMANSIEREAFKLEAKLIEGGDAGTSAAQEVKPSWKE